MFKNKQYINIAGRDELNSQVSDFVNNKKEKDRAKDEITPGFVIFVIVVVCVACWIFKKII